MESPTRNIFLTFFRRILNLNQLGEFIFSHNELLPLLYQNINLSIVEKQTICLKDLIIITKKTALKVMVQTASALCL